MPQNDIICASINGFSITMQQLFHRKYHIESKSYSQLAKYRICNFIKFRKYPPMKQK